MRKDPFGKLLHGLATGAAFGALLRAGRLSDYEVILAQLRLRDASVAKAMATAVATGGPLVHALFARGRATPQIQPMAWGGVGLGAVLFGAGLALLGYCPGTSIAAAASGRRDAIAGVLGMAAGAAAFVRLYPRLKPLMQAGDRGKLALPRATRSSARPWLAGVAVATAAGDVLLPGGA